MCAIPCTSALGSPSLGQHCSTGPGLCWVTRPCSCSPRTCWWCSTRSLSCGGPSVRSMRRIARGSETLVLPRDTLPNLHRGEYRRVVASTYATVVRVDADPAAATDEDWQ